MKKFTIALCLLEAASLNAMEGDILINLIRLMPEKTQEIRELVGTCDEHHKTVKSRPAFKSIRTAYVSPNTEGMMKLIYQKTPVQMMDEGRFEEAMKVFKNRLDVAEKSKNVPLANEAEEYIAEANRRMVDCLRRGTPGIRYVDFRKAENLESLLETNASEIARKNQDVTQQWLLEDVLRALKRDHPGEKISIACAKVLLSRCDFRSYIYVGLKATSQTIIERTNVDLREPGNFEDLCAAVDMNCDKLILGKILTNKLKEDYPGERILNPEYALYLLRLHDRHAQQSTSQNANAWHLTSWNSVFAWGSTSWNKHTWHTSWNKYAWQKYLHLQDVVKFDDSDRSQKIKNLFEKFKAVPEWFGNSPEIDAYYTALEELGEPRL